MKNIAIFCIAVMLIEQGSAQSCSCPNMGPELVINGDFSTGNSGFTSNYQYSSFAWPGYYGITTNAQTNNSNWCTGGDHTSGTGNFFWVDASNTTTGVLIWEQTFTVQPNTNYVFSCWVSTLDPQGPGTLQFSINNSLIGPLLTAPATLCSWVQYCVTWNSGNNTSAAVGIANQSVFFAGNDMGIDDISFRECQTNCVITATASANDTICNGGSVQLSSGGGTFYSWAPSTGLNNPSSQNPVASPGTTTTYTVNVSDGTCTDSAFVTIFVINPPTLNLAPGDTICPGGSVQLNASGATTYSWSSPQGLSSTVIANPVASPATSTTYTVTGNNGYCSATATVSVIVIPNPTAIASASITSGEAPLQVQFTSQSLNASSVTWQVMPMDSMYYSDFQFTFTEPGIYPVTLWVINANGCPDSITIFIEVKPNSTIFVPNAFTPDGDGTNDLFQAYTTGIEKFRAWIFDRWGNLIYSWDDKNGGWDGRMNGNLVQEDVYVWKIDAIGVDEKRYTPIGHVSVIR